jgi:hypothetical protein
LLKHAENPGLGEPNAAQPQPKKTESKARNPPFDFAHGPEPVEGKQIQINNVALF